MACFTRSSRFPILAVALTLGLAVKVPAQVPLESRPSSLSSKLESAFSPPQGPGAPNPDNTQGGATRNPCTEDTKPFQVLVPAFGIGQTAAEYPTIYWYMPKLSPEDQKTAAVEFVLKDANDQKIYSATYPLAKSAEGVVGTPGGIMSLTVAKGYPLKIDQEYHWELTMMCDSTDKDMADNMFQDGRIKRVEVDPTLAVRLQQATPQDRVALYATEKLWFETVATLIELRRDRPNDTNLADAWVKLLASVGLDIISKEPLFPAARTNS
jgi:hypothetical protein